MATKSLTTGNDKIIGTAAADAIDGLAGNDTISGMSGNDTLIGGIGADSLDGGTENDSLLGGAGNDILIGGTGSDLLNGGTENDALNGGAGVDTLIGGTGMDTMIGGDGNDFYTVDHARDVITELTGSLSGVDSVSSSVDYTLAANIENLTLTGLNNLKGTGNTAKNLITGNAGNNYLDGSDSFDTLIGGGGDDTLMGGTGVDKLMGGDGSDTYQMSSTEDSILETAKDGDQDVVASSISYALGDNLEVLFLTGLGAIDGTGNEMDNIIEGNNAENALNGVDGADILNGYAGDDAIDGGAGDDVIDGGEGNDTVFFQGNQDDYKIYEDSGVTVVEDINGSEGDGAEEGMDQITNVETLVFADSELLIGVSDPGMMDYGM